MNNIEQLKLPPNNAEAEVALISAMITDNRLINDVDHIKEEDFYRHEHQIIYRRMSALNSAGKPVDPVTLIEALTDQDEIDHAGGVDYIVDIVSAGRGGSNAAHYASIITQRALSRKIIAIGNQISDIGYQGGDVSEKIDQIQSLTMGLTQSGTNEPRHIRAILRDAVADIDRRAEQGGEIVGLETGFTDLDRMTAGFHDGQLIIIAARPAMGKTTLAMNIAENVSMQGKTVLVFNLEMSSVNLALKTISSLGRVPYNNLRSGQIGDYGSNVTAGAAKIIDRQLHIDDNGSLTSTQILSRTRKISQKIGKKIDMVVVDYLQLLNDKGEGHERITKISRALKMAAREIQCPVVALSQLNRGLESRSDKRPLMGDLRESGAIEQDADTIIMLYRDEVYNDDTNQKGICEAIIRKNREGENGTVYIAANLHVCRFDNLPPGYQPPAQEPQRRNTSFSNLDRR